MADTAQNHGHDHTNVHGHSHTKNPTLKRLKSTWLAVFFIFAAVAVFDFPGLPDVMWGAAESLIGTLPFFLFAVFLVAYLKAAGAEAMIADAFKGREVRMIFLAALFGGLTPFCSCEVIPFIAGLLALGATLSAVMAFWLSSPLIDPPTLLITASALGWPFAIAKAVSAVAIGILGGFAIKSAAGLGVIRDPLKPQPASGCGCGPSPQSGAPKWAIWTEQIRRTVFASEFKANFMFLLKWLAFAYVLEAILITYVPADLIARAVGGTGIFPIVTAAIVGMPAYLNGYVAPPLLAGLMTQGMSAGAALSFMIAGSISCIPAMAAVWSLVKPKVFGLYIALGLIGAIAAGVIFQMLN